MRILVVEDEPVLADAIAEWLRNDAHAVDVVYDGAAALERTTVNDYDVVVLDRDIPAVHGDDVCRELIEDESDVRVLMLTAAGQVSDRVAGLMLGADDYLAKPFAFAELSARVHALGRRSRPAAPPVLRRAGIILDPARREVFRDGRLVPLSRKEFAVLAELLRADGAAVSAEQLLEKVWDEFAGPVHPSGAAHDLQAASEAREPPDRQDTGGSGVSHTVRVKGLPAMPRRVSLRARLTLVYGATFLVAGVVLLATTYALFNQELSRSAPGFSISSTADEPDDARSGDAEPPTENQIVTDGGDIPRRRGDHLVRPG